MISLYRVFPYLKSSSAEEPGGALFVPPQGGGRIGNPDYYSVLYLSDAAAGAIAEAFGRFPEWSPAILEGSPALPGNVTPPTNFDPGSFAIYWGLDDKLKTPYSHVFDFSITRELARNYVLEASYVGRLGHRLLQEEDLAMPLDIIDPGSKVDYFAAATMLTKAQTPISMNIACSAPPSMRLSV